MSKGKITINQTLAKEIPQILWDIKLTPFHAGYASKGIGAMVYTGHSPFFKESQEACPEYHLTKEPGQPWKVQE